MSRLKLAEAGSFIPLIEKFMHAVQLSKPKAPGRGIWEAQCAKAAKASLSGGWRLAFRALECSTALPKNQATFDKVKATYITKPLTDTSGGLLRSLCEDILHKANNKTSKRLTTAMVDKRMKSLKGAAQPGSTSQKHPLTAYYQSTLGVGSDPNVGSQMDIRLCP